MDTHRIIEKQNHEILEPGNEHTTMIRAKDVVWRGDHEPTLVEQVDTILGSEADSAERTVQERRLLIHLSKSALDIKWGFGWRDLYNFDQSETLFNFGYDNEIEASVSL